MRYAFGECDLDVGCYELRRGGKVVPLGPKVFEVLLYLIRHRERVVSKQELFDTLWPAQFVSDAALVRCIAAARRAIGDGSGQAMIKTQYGRGYRFMPDVAICDVDPSPPSAAGSEAAPAAIPLESDNHTPAPSIDERKPVTALSCRLGQLEALSAELTPEALHNLLHGFFERAARRVEHYDGTVTQFTSDGLMALFGVPVAHEDHAQRALLVASALQHSIRQYGEGEGLPPQTPLVLHIGMHTGEVVGRRIAERQAVTYLEVGNTLRLTTQLQQLAPAGALLLSAASAPRVEHAARLEIYAGESESPRNGATVAYRVRQIDRQRLGVLRAWPHRLSRFVSRGPELSTLHALMSRAERGQGQVVGIVGEAGLGKSRLLYEFRRRLQGRPYTYLRGQCLSYGQATPYQPLHDLLQRHCRIADADPPEAISDKLRRWLEAVGLDVDSWLPHLLALVDIDVLSEALSRLNPQARRARTLEALVRLVLASSRQGALIVEIENLHWIDASSEECLTLLVERLAGAPVLLILSYRPGYALPWTGKSYVSVLPLSPLDPEASRQVVEDASDPVQLPPQVLDEIVTRGDGNPFFLEELGVSVKQQDRRVSPQVPETVQLVLAARLDRLPAAAKRLLQTAAVIGVEVPQALLKTVAALPEEALYSNLSTLQGAEVLYEVSTTPEPVYRFKHALTQEATYRSLLSGARQRLHGRIAEALMAHFPEWVEREPELVAHHYSAAGLYEPAIDYWQQAGQQAIDQVAYVEAVAYLNRALQLLQTLPENQATQERCMTILLQQERLYETLGRREQQQATIDQLFMRLQPTGEQPAHLAEVYVRQGDLYTQMGRFDEAERALDEALALRRAHSDAIGETHVLRSMGFLRWHQSRYEEAVTCNEAALAIDRQRDDSTAIASDLINLGAVLRNIGEHERALVCLEEALHLYETVQNPVKQAFTLHSIANVHRELGATVRAMTAYQQAYDIFMQHHDLVMASRSLAGMAHLYWEQGDTDDSLRLYEDALRITRDSHHGHSLAHTLRTLGDRLLTLNEPEKAMPYFLESTDVFAELGDGESEAESWEKLAAIYEQTLADDQQAFAAWEKARALRNQVPDCRGVLEALQHMGRLARHRLGKPTWALHYFRQALELAMTMGDHAKQGELLNTLGIMAWQRGAYADALGHYEQALRLYGEIADAAHTGLILNSIGATLYRLQRYDAALVRLQAALAVNRQANQRLLEGHGLAVIGDVYRALDRDEQALDHYQASLNIRREIGDRKGEGWMLYSLALVYAAQGTHAKAHDCVRQALYIAEECRDAELHRVCISLQG